MKLSAVAVCSWCGEHVKRRNLPRHFREGCLKVPTVAVGERMCSRCQQPKAVTAFHPDPAKHWCKACSLENFHEHRRLLKTGQITKPMEPMLRPGRWVLNPCKFCGERFNFKEMRKHLPFCPKNAKARPERVGKPRKAMSDMASAKNAHIAIPLERRQKHRNLIYCYGIGLAEYDRLVVEHSGRCAICGTADSGANTGDGCLHVDHDHATGKIRGLLCTACNHLLGNCRDNPALLIAALAYLAAYRPVDVVT